MSAADLLEAEGASDSEEAADVINPDPAADPQGHGDPPLRQIRVPKTASQTLLLPVGVWPDQPLRSTFDKVLASIRPLPGEKLAKLDADLARVASFYLDEQQPTLHSSKTSIAQLTGVGADKLEPHLGLLINTLLHLDRQQQCSLEESIVQDSGAELVAYIEFSRYDETPMKVTHSHRLGQWDLALPSTPGGLPPPELADQRGGDANSLAFKAATVSKMFNTQHQVAMLLKCGFQTDAGLDEQLLAVTSSAHTWNQLLGNATGECLSHCCLDGDSLDNREPPGLSLQKQGHHY